MNVLEQMAYLGPCAELPIFAKSFKFLTLRGLNGVGLEKILKKVARLIKVKRNLFQLLLQLLLNSHLDET